MQGLVQQAVGSRRSEFRDGVFPFLEVGRNRHAAGDWMWMEDKPGALMRVAGVVTTKGCSIESLTVVLDPCRPCASRVIIVADIEPYFIVSVIPRPSGADR